MTRRLVLSVLLLVGASGPVRAASSMPPPNPFLAASTNALGHGTSAQQDATPTPGPAGEASRTLEPSELAYTHLGPGHFGANISGPYADGRRVLWSNGFDRVVKVDHDSFEVLATFPLPDAPWYPPERADVEIERLDRRRGLGAVVSSLGLANELFTDLSGVYTLLDRDHRYYVGGHQSVTVYADAEPGVRESPIEAVRTWRIPESVSGFLIGMNMTYDGWIVLVTEHGFVVAVSRDFRETRIVRMRHSDGAEDKATRPTGGGWVRNGAAIDREGGIYVASQSHMHKIVWTGDRLSVDEADGAWTEPYSNGTGEGTGATPSLMGFGDEDRLVVITDGDVRMNVVVFWRDEIPPDPPGGTGSRTAGVAPADLGDPALEALQSEQSVVVAGYGALVVSNQPRNVPIWLPNRAEPLLAGFLGSRPLYQPFGVQKFEWDPQRRRLEQAWARPDLSSPNGVPLASLGSGRVYTVGARGGSFTLEALDWETGESDFHWVVGTQRYNSLFSGLLIDEAGRVMWGTTWGRVRLDPLSRSGTAGVFR